MKTKSKKPGFWSFLFKKKIATPVVVDFVPPADELAARQEAEALLGPSEEARKQQELLLAYKRETELKQQTIAVNIERISDINNEFVKAKLTVSDLESNNLALKKQLDQIQADQRALGLLP